MKIIVCIKQVPNTTKVRLEPKTGTLIRDGVPSIINPDDTNALEAAISLKESLNDGSEVIVVSMGPAQAEVALREALAMGADRAILISDRAFGGSDTWATSYIISAAIKKIDYDIIFCGRQAIDGDTAQVGPQIAENLGIPQVTYAQNLKFVDKNTLRVEGALEDGFRIVEVKLPCLITAIKELNIPRYANIRGIFDAYREKEVEVLCLKDLPLNTERIGLKGSPTNVYRTFTPGVKGEGVILEGADKNTVSNLFSRLREKNIL